MKKSISKQPSTLLIIGLGNPGEEYQDTPHNAGFLVINALLKEFGLEVSENKKLHSHVAEYKVGKTKVVFVKPQTFMNNSGTAAGSVARYYKTKPENTWIIHDDVDLPLGKIKIVKNRGSAGHKGVEDIIRNLKTKDFVRFRIGTRPKNLKKKRPKTLMNKFVASQISKSDQRLFKKSIKFAYDAVLLALKEGVEKATSIYNAK